MHLKYGIHIQVLSHNVTAVCYINCFGGSSKTLFDLDLCYEKDIFISATYLPVKDNAVADRLSRCYETYSGWELHSDILIEFAINYFILILTYLQIGSIKRLLRLVCFLVTRPRGYRF